MKLSFFSGLLISLVLVLSCKQKSEESGSEDSFIKNAVSQNPGLLAPVTQPMSEGEDKLISSSRNTQDYFLAVDTPFDPKDIAQHQAMSDSTPPTLQGIWWMNGNPLSDKTVSFANLKFEAKNGKQVGYFPVFGSNNYTFLADEGGKSLYNMCRQFDVIYEITFNNEFTEGNIVPTLKVGPVRVRIPKSIVEFTMSQKEDGYFIRDSKFLGKALAPYHFIRVIDKNKNPVMTQDRWNSFLASSPKLVIAKLK